MNLLSLCRIKLLFVVFALAASAGLAATPEVAGPGSPNRIYGGPAGFAKTVTDTVLVMGPWGSGAAYNGQFETADGLPDWNGWAGNDLTSPGANPWHADTYHAVSGQYSAWCGSLEYPACGSGDEDGGYGNNWDEYLEWRGPVADVSQPCTVQIDGLLNYDMEPGYDFMYVECVTAGDQVVQLAAFDGGATGVPLSASFTYAPADYVAGEVVVRFRVVTDTAWSDEDCLWKTIGAVQLDDVVIGLSNGVGAAHDFEDGTLGPFDAPDQPGVGDFARIWTGLRDVDPCATNSSPQVAFIDDGVVVPGTGGTPCQSHCYGPGGFIVNNTGGLRGPESHLNNAVESPVMAWPAGYAGGLLEFTAFEDDYLFEAAEDPGILYSWSVRSASGSDPAAVLSAPWTGPGLLYLNETFDGRYHRVSERIGEYLVPDATFVQVQLVALEVGFLWGPAGTDGTPAPYFDNVRVTAAAVQGPQISAYGGTQFLDGFPAGGTLDMTDPGSLGVRLDTGVLPDALGDTLVIRLQPMRPGAVLSGLPTLHYRLLPNPVFDPYRTSGLPNTGVVSGWELNPGSGNGLFVFDLPDSGFFYPGDRLRYYFEGRDDAGGVIQAATLPADTTGFTGDDFLAYDDRFTVRGLPTISAVAGSPGVFTQPDLLLVDETSTGQAEPDIWLGSLAQLGLYPGLDFDLVLRQEAGATLARRISPTQLGAYNDLLLTYGTGRGNDTGEQMEPLLEGWFGLGDRDLLLMGGDGVLAYPASFHSGRLGVNVEANQLAAQIDGQDFPGVLPVAGNPVFTSGDLNWRHNGRCGSDGERFGRRKLTTALAALPGAVALAEFTDRSGAPGAYGLGAAILNVTAADNGRAVTIPASLRQLVTTPSGAKAIAPLNARSRVLGAVLAYFGQVPDPGPASNVPEAGQFIARARPNPFNPATLIAYNLPRDGHLRLTIYDVRGRRVRRLLDEQRPVGPGQVLWEGTDDQGNPVSSGVYFFETRSGGSVLVGKLALVK